MRRAMICGSTRGIGRACAERLAEDGMAVTLVARSADALEAEVRLLPNQDAKHHTVTADFDNPEQVAVNVSEYLAAGHQIDVLVNNSGGPPGGDLLHATWEEFETALNRHLRCNHLLAQLLVPGMRERHWGRIINIVSTSVKQPLKGLGVSNTTRGAVASWAKTLANEVATYGITVNNVLPGATWTDRIREIIAAKAKKQNVSTDAVQQAMVSQIPAGRFAEPEETAAAVSFLASVDAGYITGVSLPVDGGRLSCL